MIEVRLFATLRQGRGKVQMSAPENFTCAGSIIPHLEIPAEEVAILLINGFHQKPETPVQDGLFPLVGGG